MSSSTVSTRATPLHRDLPPDVFVGRQAIVDGSERVWAYEIRYGQVGNHVANSEAHDPLTLGRVLSAIVDTGTERTLGSRDVLVYCPEEALREDLPPLITRERLLLQVPADLTLNDTTLQALTTLRQQGARLAVRWHHAPIEPALLDLVTVVRFDVNAIYSDALRERVNEMRDRKLLVMADGIADWDDHRRAVELGFDYFQGDFLCAAQTIEARRPPSGSLATLAMLTDLQRQDVTMQDIELHLQRDVGLSFRLLRCLSSAAVARRSPITSVKHAVVMLGLDHLRRLVTMLSLSTLTQKPPELLSLALTRAAMCQQLAVKSGHCDPATAYTVGLFSVLDALLDWPMEAILAELPIAESVSRALLEYEGPAGDILRCTVGYEAGHFRDAALIHLTIGDLSSAYLTAISWADAASDELGAHGASTD